MTSLTLRGGIVEKLKEVKKLYENDIGRAINFEDFIERLVYAYEYFRNTSLFPVRLFYGYGIVKFYSQ